MEATILIDLASANGVDLPLELAKEVMAQHEGLTGALESIVDALPAAATELMDLREAMAMDDDWDHRDTVAHLDELAVDLNGKVLRAVVRSMIAVAL